MAEPRAQELNAPGAEFGSGREEPDYVVNDDRLVGPRAREGERASPVVWPVLLRAGGLEHREPVEQVADATANERGLRVGPVRVRREQEAVTLGHEGMERRAGVRGQGGDLPGGLGPKRLPITERGFRPSPGLSSSLRPSAWYQT